MYCFDTVTHSAASLICVADYDEIFSGHKGNQPGDAITLQGVKSCGNFAWDIKRCGFVGTVKRSSSIQEHAFRAYLSSSIFLISGLAFAVQ